MTDLSDYLRDDDDIVDVLEAHGREIPPTAAERRQCAIALFKEIPTNELLTLFSQHATGFMRMVQEIDQFCQSVGATVGGRIQIQTEGLPLHFDGLSSSWVFDGPSDWESAEQRALALAEELRYLTEEFDAERATGSRQSLTAFGSSLKGTVFESFDLDGTHETETTVRDVDLDQLIRIRNDVQRTQLLLQNTDVPPAIASALDLAASKLDEFRKVLDRHVRVHGEQPSEALVGLHCSLDVLLAQLARLAAEVDAGRRANQERGDFLRTEFWKQRWRLYEIWLLTRVLSALRDSGADINLSGLTDGVWNLRYGRSEAPVATAIVGETPLKIYYQLHIQSDAAADMPDIVVMGAKPILVLDPKHGRSYTRGKVQAVLTRYANSFCPALTAIVNYYPLRSYPFEVTSHGDRRWLLASGIAPFSIGIQRLELLIRESLLVTGHIAHAAANTSSKTLNVRTHRTSTQAFIVFYTRFDVEVDAPAGFWSVRAGRGPEWLSAFERITGSQSDLWSKDFSIQADPRANSWFISVHDRHQTPETVLWRLSEGNPPKIEDAKLVQVQSFFESSPSRRFEITKGPRSKRDGVVFLKVEDHQDQMELPLIRCYGSYARDFRWAPDGRAVAFMLNQGNENRLMIARVGDRYASPASLPGQEPTAFGWMTPALLDSMSY